MEGNWNLVDWLIVLLSVYLLLLELLQTHAAPSPESPDPSGPESGCWDDSDSDFEQALIQVSLKIRSNQSNQHKRALPARSYLGHLLQWLRLRCHPASVILLFPNPKIRCAMGASMNGINHSINQCPIAVAAQRLSKDTIILYVHHGVVPDTDVGLPATTFSHQNFVKAKHRHRRNVMSYRFKSLFKLFSLFLLSSLLWLFYFFDYFHFFHCFQFFNYFHFSD